MKTQLESLIRDYHWKRKEVDRLQGIIYGGSSPMRSWGVALYGIEATMPRGSSIRSHEELRDMDLREERMYKRLEKLESEVYALESAPEYLDGEKEKIVFDCLLDGMSYREIGLHLEMSRESVRNMKNTIICQLCQNCQFRQLLIREKSAC